MTVFFNASNILVLNANAQTTNNTVNYTVKKGDTFYLLGLRFNSSINDISSINPEINPQNLIIGSTINLPLGSDIVIHHVKKDDTLWKIAREYNSTVNLIAKKNYIPNPNLIYSGDIIAIPQSMRQLLQMAGTWTSTGTTQYHTTQLSIDPTGYNTFNIELFAEYGYDNGPIVYEQSRNMLGKGEIKNNKIEFVITEPDITHLGVPPLKGEITVENNILKINFIGDLKYYNGPRVGFENEFYHGIDKKWGDYFKKF